MSPRPAPFDDQDGPSGIAHHLIQSDGARRPPSLPMSGHQDSRLQSRRQPRPVAIGRISPTGQIPAVCRSNGGGTRSHAKRQPSVRLRLRGPTTVRIAHFACIALSRRTTARRRTFAVPDSRPITRSAFRSQWRRVRNGTSANRRYLVAVFMAGEK